MVRWLSRLCLVTGLLLLLSPLLTNAYGKYQQQRLLAELEDAAAKDTAGTWENPVIELPDKAGAGPENNGAQAAEAQPATEAQPQEQVPAQQPKPKPVQGVFTLYIPALGVKAAVVKGVEPQDLRKGPGLYPSSAMPGEDGNVAIAGHRNTYGSWFRNINKLQEGDEIVIRYQKMDYVYIVERVFICAKDDWTVVAPTGSKALTLTTCDPPGAVKQRLVVRAIWKE